MLRLAFDFIITWRETRTRPNAYGVMTRGCDDGRYPMARTITFGLQVNF